MHVVVRDELVRKRVDLLLRELHVLVLELHGVLDTR